MKIIRNKNKLVKELDNCSNLGFVPTMGALHKGHISLIKKSTKQNKKTLVSIYVNKPQFNNKKDFNLYPRTLKSDIQTLKRNNVDILYLPKNKDLYPRGPNKLIKINLFEKRLCGKFRPGHFKAVVDVIRRFVEFIKPNKIYMGSKDFQQLKLVEDFFIKNKVSTKVVECKTVRNKNGLALSSRNFLLTSEQKRKAEEIYKILHNKKGDLLKNKMILNSIKRRILKLNDVKIDYIEVVNISKFFKTNKKNNLKIFIAYYLGETRLIDNI